MAIDLEVLKQVPLFKSWNFAELLMLSEHTTEQILAPHETVYHAGECVQTIFVTLNGKIRLFIPGTYGRPVILAHVSLGGIFGELSPLPTECCVASAVTLTEA